MKRKVYVRGSGYVFKKVVKPLSNYDILYHGRAFRGFMGCFMRDELPDKNLTKGCGVMNLDDSLGPGTHWTAWWKNIYFDTYGLPPPEEFLDKVNGATIEYNNLDIQNGNDPPFCGHVCWGFLEAMNEGRDPVEFMLSVYRVINR